MDIKLGDNNGDGVEKDALAGKKEVKTDMEVLLCEICGAELGTFNLKDIKFPLQGSMFGGLRPGYPPPFNPVLPWEFLYCPMCTKRAFITVNHIVAKNKAVNGDDLPNKIFRVDREGPQRIQEYNAVAEASKQASVVMTATVNVEAPQEAADEAPDIEVVAPVKKAKGSAKEATDKAKPTPKPTVDDLIKSGAIKKAGSWYRYKGKSYRLDELAEAVKNG